MKYNLDQMLAECIDECFVVGIQLKDIDPHIRINTRLRKTFARCLVNKSDYCRIEFASFVLKSDNEKEIRNTMMHEVLHAGIGIDNRVAEGHDHTWRKYAEIVNNEFGYNVSRYGTYEEYGLKEPETVYRYETYCENCGKVNKHERMCHAVEHPSCWKCGNCGTTLKSRGINGFILYSA